MEPLSAKQLSDEIKSFKPGKGADNKITGVELKSHVVSHYCKNNPNKVIRVAHFIEGRIGNMPKKLKMVKVSGSVSSRVVNMIKSNKQLLKLEVSNEGRAICVKYNPNPNPNPSTIEKVKRKPKRKTTSYINVSFDKFEPILDKILKKCNKTFKEREIMILEARLEWLKTT